MKSIMPQIEIPTRTTADRFNNRCNTRDPAISRWRLIQRKWGGKDSKVPTFPICERRTCRVGAMQVEKWNCRLRFFYLLLYFVFVSQTNEGKNREWEKFFPFCKESLSCYTLYTKQSQKIGALLTERVPRERCWSFRPALYTRLCAIHTYMYRWKRSREGEINVYSSSHKKGSDWFVSLSLSVGNLPYQIVSTECVCVCVCMSE